MVHLREISSAVNISLALSSGGRRGRWYKRTIMCASLGVLCTWIVAWAAAALLSIEKGPWIHRAQDERAPIPHRWSVIHMKRLGGQMFLSERWKLAQADGIEVTSRHPGTLLKSWGNAGTQTGRLQTVGNEIRVTMGYGWPMVALWCDFTYEYVVTSPVAQVRSIGHAIQWQSRRSPLSPIHPWPSLSLLPVGIYWPGLVVNSAVMMAAWFGGLYGCRVIRATSRCLLGHCPSCGYDLRGDLAGGCSECGWRRETDASRALP